MTSDMSCNPVLTHLICQDVFPRSLYGCTALAINKPTSPGNSAVGLGCYNALLIRV